MSGGVPMTTSSHDHRGLCNAALRRFHRAFFNMPVGTPKRRTACNEASAQLDTRRRAMLTAEGCLPEEIEQMLAGDWVNGWQTRSQNPPADPHELDTHALWRKLRKVRGV